MSTLKFETVLFSFHRLEFKSSRQEIGGRNLLNIYLLLEIFWQGLGGRCLYMLLFCQTFKRKKKHNLIYHVFHSRFIYIHQTLISMKLLSSLQHCKIIALCGMISIFDQYIFINKKDLYFIIMNTTLNAGCKVFIHTAVACLIILQLLHHTFLSYCL